MPEMDGYEFCRLARKVSEAPIMLLTAHSKEQEKVKGFDMGADGYEVKPVGMKESLARVGALLRCREPTIETDFLNNLVTEGITA